MDTTAEQSEDDLVLVFPPPEQVNDEDDDHEDQRIALEELYDTEKKRFDDTVTDIRNEARQDTDGQYHAILAKKENLSSMDTATSEGAGEKRKALKDLKQFTSSNTPTRNKRARKAKKTRGWSTQGATHQLEIIREISKDCCQMHSRFQRACRMLMNRQGDGTDEDEDSDEPDSQPMDYASLWEIDVEEV